MLLDDIFYSSMTPNISVQNLAVELFTVLNVDNQPPVSIWTCVPSLKWKFQMNHFIQKEHDKYSIKMVEGEESNKETKSHKETVLFDAA